MWTCVWEEHSRQREQPVQRPLHSPPSPSHFLPQHRLRPFGGGGVGGGHVGKVVPSGICPPAGLVIFHFTWIQAYQALSSYSLVPLKVWRGAGRGKELPFTRSRLSPSLGSPLPQPDTYWTVRLRNSSTSPTSPNQALAYLIPPDPGNFTFKSLWSPSFDSGLQPQTRSQLSPLSTHFKLIVFNFKSDRASLERAFSVWPHSVNVLSSLSFRP